MAFKDILGHEMAKRVLKNSLNKGTISHAYLFVGSEGVGRRFTAMIFAKALNCINKRGDSCDECLSCRKIGNLSHPDLNIIEPEDKSIKIESIRELQKKLSLKPYEGRKKIVIINGAEDMTDGAVNAFLKTLEEPPGETVIILITSNLHSLLPTVVSRCQIVRFNALSCDHVREILIKNYRFSKEDAMILSSLSRGKLGRAITMDYKVVCKLREEALRLIMSSVKGDMEYIFTKSKGFTTDKEGLNDFLDFIVDILRDVIVIKGTATDELIINKDMKDKLKWFSEKLQIPFIINMIDTVERTKYLLKRNVNPKLAIETMAIGMELRS